MSVAEAEATPTVQSAKPCPFCGTLEIFDKKSVAARAKRSQRAVEQDVTRAGCPLRFWYPRSGAKKKITDAPTLSAYLAWLAEGR